MKKISNYLLTASVFVMANVSAFADGEQKGVCDLLKSLESVIDTLRALAFIGAVFLLKDWAWGYIKDPSKATKDDMKDKGVGLLVGFFLLFGVGVILTLINGSYGQSLFGCDYGFLTKIK